MSDKPETTGDIVREMRSFGERCDHRPFSWQMVERCRECKAKSGNAAALREALEGVASSLAMHIKCGRFVAPGDHVSFPISEAEAYIRDIRAALSAPQRNCDRHKCAWDAQREFRRVFRDPYGKPAPSCDNPAYWPLFANWLFAPAEGGAE